MNIQDCVKSYFDGYQEIANYKTNGRKENAVAALKIVSYAAFSYLSLVLRAAFAAHAVYTAYTLYGRVSPKKDPSAQDDSVPTKTGAVTEPVIVLPKRRQMPLDIMPFKDLSEAFAKREFTTDQTNYMRLDTFITIILNKREFREDPAGYVQNWKNNLGKAAPHFLPLEPAALRFFETEVLPKL